jgi:hypothetical protein
MSSISFLEALLNELFASAAHDNLEVGGRRGPLPERERRALCDVVDMLERNNFLDKFQHVLHLLNRQPFNLGSALPGHRSARKAAGSRKCSSDKEIRWGHVGDIAVYDAAESLQNACVSYVVDRANGA